MGSLEIYNLSAWDSAIPHTVNTAKSKKTQRKLAFSFYKDSKSQPLKKKVDRVVVVWKFPSTPQLVSKISLISQTRAQFLLFHSTKNSKIFHRKISELFSGNIISQQMLTRAVWSIFQINTRIIFDWMMKSVLRSAWQRD